MAIKIPSLKSLDFSKDEDGTYWIQLEQFYKYLKEKHKPEDSIKTIRKSNLAKEFKGFKHGFKDTGDGSKDTGISGYISLKGIIRFAIQHQEKLDICAKITDQIESLTVCKIPSTEICSTKDLYTNISKTEFHDKRLESTLTKHFIVEESNIPSLYSTYRTEFNREEWAKIALFEYYFSKQKWNDSILEDNTFEDILKQKESFLEEIKSVRNIAQAFQISGKDAIESRIQRFETAHELDEPRIEAGKYYLPDKIEKELNDYLKAYAVSSVLALDCTKECQHSPSIHIYLQLETCELKYTSDCVDAVQVVLEKHGSSCAEIFFVRPKTFEKSSRGGRKIARFQIRDMMMSGKLADDILLRWRNDDIEEPMSENESEFMCNMCFDSSLPKPLHWRNFDIVTEWLLDVPVQVQIILESFINPKSLKKTEDVPALLEKKLTKLYGLYDALLNVSNGTYSGVVQDINTHELALNYRSVRTVFSITSGFGTTMSLSIAERNMKDDACDDKNYYNTYLKKHKIEYNTLAGRQIAEKSLRQCILVFMIDNLVRLTFFTDPGPDKNKSQQICTLPISLKGIPDDSAEIERWHDPEKCDGSLLCLCKHGQKMNLNDVTKGFLELKAREKDCLDRFKMLITWGYNDVWSYITNSEYLYLI